MLEIIYTSFFLVGIICLVLYRVPKIALYIGLAIPCIISIFSTIYFIKNINSTYGFKLAGNFLFSPHFIITPLSGFFSFIITFIAIGICIYTIGYIKEFKDRGNLAVFAALFNFFILSMLLVVSSSDVFSFIVLWEIMTLISALLLKFNDEKHSNKTVMIYLSIAQIGAFCILIALLFISYFAGSFSFIQWSKLDIDPTVATCILILLLIGFGSKIGMFPFHVWAPLVYPLAPSNVAGMLSGIMSKMAIFGIIQFSVILPITSGFALSVVALGAISALIGITYALIQNDYIKLISYSSVENLGIIMLGVGVGFYGISIAEPTLVLLGFIGALFHVLNHSTFKSLLFLGSGSIYSVTRTKNMNSLGGLARKMPFTALFFLIGAISISALPPLNGFISEWFIYRSMFMGALDDSIASRLIFALAIICLALTGAMVVYAFIKLYGVIFAGTPKDENIHNRACEKSFFMPFGMFILAFSSIYFAVFANNIILFLGNVVLYLVPQTMYSMNINVISMPAIMILLMFALALPFLLFGLFGANMSKVRASEPWACGFKFSPQMSMNSNSFVGDFKRLISKVIKFKTETKQQNYFSNVDYKTGTEDVWWKILYEPIIKFNMLIADKIGAFQNGRSSFYVVYILVYLYAMLVVGFYFLGA
ncbi:MULTISPECIES: proton-conducting transporter membrane subunit [Campylobacter]|uniref:proton-conducting transporter transmembrane domain-containing protein n=1 Tax=Campylobacter TaxID=194 RepID=UPI00138E0A0B|nr:MULTISPECIES: proton-conducting transporter membrane subunit [Campylobacter]MDV2489996.1 proton-conducting transporter membrane subunit [Campylobacter sp. TJR-1]